MIFHWIQHIADYCDLSTLTKTSMDIVRYTGRLTASKSPLYVEELRACALDLSRVMLTFKDRLRQAPSAIHDLIPTLCLRGGAFARAVAGKPAIMKYSGLQSSSWDDCIARMQAGKATRFAFGEALLALEVRKDYITVYDTAFLNMVLELRHPGVLLQLHFGRRDQLLFSARRDEVCI